MYWYLRKYEDSPQKRVDMLADMRDSGEIERMPKDDVVALVKEVTEWEHTAGKFFFDPNAKEGRFFLQPEFIKGISGGNRSGKTCTCVMDVMMQCEGWHPLQRANLERLAKEAVEKWVREWCQELLDRKAWINNPPVYARCVTVDFPNYVEKVIGPEYEKWSTHAEVSEFAYANEKKRIIRWNNGSFVEFMTYEQALKAHGGAARHLIHFDEEPPSEIWQENMMRVISTNGRMIIGMTAVDGITWSEEEIWRPGEEGHKNVYTMEMSTYENPVNTKAVVENIKSMCIDKTEVDIRIYGKRKRRGGLVYKMAKDEYPWIIPRFKIPDDGYIVCCVDPHPRVEHAALWLWVDYEGVNHELIDGKPNIYEVAELFEHGTIPELKNKMDIVETMLGRKHDYMLCDPSGWIKDQSKQNDRSTFEQFNDVGVFPLKGSKDLPGGILKVAELLNIHIDKLGNERPRLFCFEDLSRLRWERKNYHWPEWKGKLKDSKNPLNRPVDKDDHMMENERRGAVFVDESDFELIEAPTEREMIEQEKRRLFNAKGDEIDVNFEEDELEELEYTDPYML